MRLDKTDIILKPSVDDIGKFIYFDNRDKSFHDAVVTRNSYGIGINENRLFYLAMPNEAIKNNINGRTYLYNDATGHGVHPNKTLFPFSLEKSYWTKQGLTIDTGYKAPFIHDGEIINAGRKLIPTAVNREHYIEATLPGNGWSNYDFEQVAINVRKSEKYNLIIEITQGTHVVSRNINLSGNCKRVTSYDVTVKPLAYDYCRILYSTYAYSHTNFVKIRIYITSKSYNKTITGDGDGVVIAGIEDIFSTAYYMPQLFPTLDEGAMQSTLKTNAQFQCDLVNGIGLKDYVLYWDVDIVKDTRFKTGWSGGEFCFINKSLYSSYYGYALDINYSSLSRVNFIYNSSIEKFSIIHSQSQLLPTRIRVVAKFDSVVGKIKYYVNSFSYEHDYTPIDFNDNQQYIIPLSSSAPKPYALKEFRIMHGLTDDECQTLAKKGFIHD